MMKKQKTNDSFYAIDAFKFNNKIIIVDKKDLKETFIIEVPKIDYLPISGNKMTMFKKVEKTEAKRYVLLYDEDFLPPDKLYEGQLLSTFGFEEEYRVIIDKDGEYAVIAANIFFDDFAMHMLDDDIEGE